ncbi:MAG: hypothetical protein NTZ85_01655 [Bacteroidia bacterium]|nr:hypothetical protein [Bacteroidia bacterium]
MITAIRKGIIGTYSEKVWNLLPKHKNGWQKIEPMEFVPIPGETIKYLQAKEIPLTGEKIPMKDGMIIIEPEITQKPVIQPERPLEVPEFELIDPNTLEVEKPKEIIDSRNSDLKKSKPIKSNYKKKVTKKLKK